MKKKLLSLLLATAMIMGLAAFCQTRNHLIIPVMIGQSVKDQCIDFSMLIHGRIDADIIIRSIHNQVIPRLAKSWDCDEETYTYTFHLEENVKWHDGEPFTAEDSIVSFSKLSS